LDVRETADDTQVTDITPSAITFKAVTAQQSSASVSTIVMSDTTSVIGSNGVEVGQFQLSASSATALDFSEATVHLAVATAADPVRESAQITIAATWAAADTASAVIDGTTVTYTATNGVVADIAAGLAAAINANATTAAKVSATSSAGVVTITYLKK
jgi:hypothetical protein